MRADYRAAIVAREAANAGPHIKYRRLPKDGKLFTAEEMLLTFSREAAKVKKQTPEEQVEIFKILAMTLAAGK